MQENFLVPGASYTIEHSCVALLYCSADLSNSGDPQTKNSNPKFKTNYNA